MKVIVKNLLVFGSLMFLFSLNGTSQMRLIGERGIQMQSFISPVLINPGATGFKAEQELLFNYRNAWSSFPGSPKTVTFSYDGPIADRLGLGLQLWSDRFAAFETTKGLLSLAYSIDSEQNKVSFGLSAEYIQHKLSAEEININNLIDRNDQVILQRLDGSQYLDVSFGVYGVYQNQFIYGLTLPSLVSSRISEELSSNSLSNDFSYIVNVGIRKTFDDADIVLEPSIFIKQLLLTPFHVDLNLKADFLDESLTAGLNYTIGADKRLGVLVGAKVSNFGFYYSYNISFHDFQDYNNGSHEFSLKFNLSTKESAIINTSL